MDGFTVILSRTQTNYLNGDGNQLGYSNIQDSLVAEIDLFYDIFYGDLGWNTASFHRCPAGKYCSAWETNTNQFNLPFVSY